MNPLGITGLPCHHGVAKPPDVGCPGFPRSPPSDTKGPEQSGPFVFAEVGPPLRHGALLQDAESRGAGQELAWTQDDGVWAVSARFLKCVRAVARLSTVFGKWHISDVPKGVGGILQRESITCVGIPSAAPPRVSPLCREIRVRTSPLCRKILEGESFVPAGSGFRTSPFCRIMEPSPPPPHHQPAGIGGESGENRPFGGSSERRRSASRGPSKGHSGPGRGRGEGAISSYINDL